ncbi:MAG: SCP2 sterol-binding domain-containing protein [Gammaproteobacteria bacterium]|nr:SCP2 sterol-binding domain-containing protein [Gammaproteobacteria bacterium]MDH5736343.1 SCP2 sterol-binding domain-containing protein [Gammaproteobacteria bacterium]
MNHQALKQKPLLPAVLRLPLRFTPAGLHNRVFITAINRLFKQELMADELDFLQNKVVALHVTDAGLQIRFTLKAQQIKSCHPDCHADLSISGTVYDFLLLMSRREDPDTLFFNRRLKLAGDTELGLYVKNFLDAMDMTERWSMINKLSDRASRIAEKIG